MKTIKIQNKYNKLRNSQCYYSGGPVRDVVGMGLDRIDNKKGYTLDNVLPCVGWVNKMRNTILPVEETKIAVKAILEYRRQKNSKDDGLVKV